MNELVDRVVAGDVAAVARACRILDERAAGHLELASALGAHSGRARVIGVTGSPGVGKSSLTGALIAKLRERGERVGVVAIDPSSPFSGGALLGDRIRMQRHAGDGEVFIRSLATRGAHGGLSRSALDVVSVLAAWGAHSVLLETVGVGQAELDVLGAADTVIVVVAPGLGDDVQANKAGILEIADVFALNKADLDGADAAEQQLELALSLGAPPKLIAGVHHAASGLGRDPDAAGARPPIVRTVATRGDGLAELLAAVDRHAGFLAEDAAGRERRAARRLRHLRGVLREAVADAVLGAVGGAIEPLVLRIAAGQIDPRSAAAELLRAYALSAEPRD